MMEQKYFDEILASVWRSGAQRTAARPIAPEIMSFEKGEFEIIPLGRPIVEHRAAPAGATTIGATPEPKLYMDTFQLPCHGPDLTHVDTGSHVEYVTSTAESVRGQQDASSLGPLFARGVLYDMPKLAGGEYLPPGHAITKAELEAAEENLSLSNGSSRVALVRTGRDACLADRGEPYETDLRPGLGVGAATYLISRGFHLIGGDGGNDVRPSEVEGVSFPVHVLALVGAQIGLLDNLALEKLSERAAARRRWSFWFAMAPLPIPGATGMPIMPFALL